MRVVVAILCICVSLTALRCCLAVFFNHFIVVVAGFEVAELSVEETTTSEIPVQVVLLQNQADREITIGVRTVDGSAKGKLAHDDCTVI